MGNKFDLNDRLVSFAVAMVQLARPLPNDRAGYHIAAQLVRCGTAPAAHHSEAQGAESRRDFIHKMRLVHKELRETRTWLRICSRTEGKGQILGTALKECNELIAIVASSVQTASKK